MNKKYGMILEVRKKGEDNYWVFIVIQVGLLVEFLEKARNMGIKANGTLHSKLQEQLANPSLSTTICYSFLDEEGLNILKSLLVELEFNYDKEGVCTLTIPLSQPGYCFVPREALQSLFYNKPITVESFTKDPLRNTQIWTLRKEQKDPQSEYKKILALTNGQSPQTKTTKVLERGSKLKVKDPVETDTSKVHEVEQEELPLQSQEVQQEELHLQSQEVQQEEVNLQSQEVQQEEVNLQSQEVQQEEVNLEVQEVEQEEVNLEVQEVEQEEVNLEVQEVEREDEEIIGETLILPSSTDMPDYEKLEEADNIQHF